MQVRSCGNADWPAPPNRSINLLAAASRGLIPATPGRYPAQTHVAAYYRQITVPPYTWHTLTVRFARFWEWSHDCAAASQGSRDKSEMHHRPVCDHNRAILAGRQKPT